MQSYNLNDNVIEQNELKSTFQPKQIERPWKRQQHMMDYNTNVFSEIIEGDSLKSKIIINTCLFFILILTLKIANPEFIQDKNGDSSFKKNIVISLSLACTSFCIAYFTRT